MKNKAKITICCITYNQEAYIRQALDGFVMQKTNFPFIVRIGDDCSTDNTRKIIEEYEKKYPEIIKPIYQEQNTKIYGNLCDVLSGIETDYVAICEGDDYWTDENKLQKQVDFLENNPEFSICFHPVKVIYENNEHKSHIFPKKQKNFTFKRFLATNFIQTNSVVYRWKFKYKRFENYLSKDIMPGDWYMHLLHAKDGKIGFLKDVMAVYRRQPNGIWYNSLKAPQKIKLKYGAELINFQKNVWEKITDKSEQYFNKRLLPVLKEILFLYFSLGYFDKCNEIKENNLDLMEKIIPISNQDDLNEKYKKLYIAFLCLSIFLSLVLILGIML